MFTRRLALGLVWIAALAAGCGGSTATQHPTTNVLDPSYAALDLKTIAVVPFLSDIRDDADPDKIAGPMVEGKFVRALNAASGFTLLASSEVGRIIEKEGLQRKTEDFYKSWIADQEDVDADLIKKIATSVKCDAVIAGTVDVWHQQPVDITESGSARTSVGILVGLFDGATGKRLWLGRDENYKDALRYTPAGEATDVGRKENERTLERTNVRTAGGVYAPPEYAEVVDLVVGSLVEAFPKRKR